MGNVGASNLDELSNLSHVDLCEYRPISSDPQSGSIQIRHLTGNWLKTTLLNYNKMLAKDKLERKIILISKQKKNFFFLFAM